jgi:excinuclease ABC subunit C
MEGITRRPGVYLFRDDKQCVLYVGKARDLRARLTSYRRPGGDGRLSIRFLERDATSVETIVTRTEAEALLLEDTLIKQHKPPHNVRLKDDKSFLMLRLDRGERFPRLKLVRAHSPKVDKPAGRSRFFGPYASASAIRRTLSDLHRVVPLRDCPDSVLNHRSRPCMKYQIGLCSAPCVDKIDTQGYEELLERAVRILSGDTGELETDLQARMDEASERLDYERAAGWRDRLKALRRTVEGQGVRPRDKVDRDVLGLARMGDEAMVHRLAFREGRLTESRSHRFRSELIDEELLHTVLTALYGGGRRDVPKEILLPCEAADSELLELTLGQGLKLLQPQGGERGRMLGIAGENARSNLAQLMREEETGASLVLQVQNLLDLEHAPETIDCFDISNFQGSQVVASRVRFRRGLSDRAGYRRFKVREVDGQDDFASMREVVRRSLQRGVVDQDLPDLIVIDGGLPQLNSALEAREEAGAWEVAMVGLAKARPERKVKGQRKAASEERLFLPGVEAPIELGKNSAVRHLFERIRDEAHRFAITYHRKERGKITSALDSIPGVGGTRRKALLRRFGSVVGVKAASQEEIAAVQGISAALAQLIVEHLAQSGER